uniref:Uncharacterized protein n=1 Tax=Saimiri boliviensis boliviensis TaxID=39432 RepID=A0A2K6SLT2_SAIBB
MQSEYFQQAGQTLMFTGHICCHAKRIWQAVHHQNTSYDSRSQEVSIELVGPLHVKMVFHRH